MAAVSNENARGKLTLLQTSAKIKAILALNFFFWTLNWVDCDLVFGFWRSLVVCHHDSPAKPPDSPDWSGSLYCTDKDFVVDKMTSFSASAILIIYITRSFSMIAMGAFADAYGRRKAIIMSWVGWVSFGAFMWYSSVHVDTAHDFSVSITNQWGFILFACFVSSAFGGFPAIASSIAADSCDANMEARGQAMAALNQSQNLGSLVGFVVCFVVLLQDLTDYSRVWMVFTILCCSLLVLTVIVLEESLSKELDDDGKDARSRSICSHIYDGVRLISKDHFLFGFFLVNLINYCAIYGAVSVIGGFLLSNLRLTIVGRSVQCRDAPSVLLVNRRATV